MKLKLDSIRDVKKFYSWLFLYKSFLFKRVYFSYGDIDSNIDEVERKQIKSIVEALNIKNRKERIAFIYDQACKMIDDNVAGKNICGFKKGICINHQCLKKDYYNGCCRMCRYQSSNGCTTRNLTCKLFVCSEVKKKYKVLEYNDLKILKLLNLKNRYIVKTDYFSTREEVLKDLYTITFTWTGCRVIWRLCRNFIWLQLSKKR